MMIVCFGQGLGNQMFQYAFYLALKENYPSAILKMDIDDIIPGDHNGFELDRIFGVERKEASFQEIAVLANVYPPKGKCRKFFSNFFGVLKRITGLKLSHIRPDNLCAFMPEVFSLNPLYSYIFEGRWTDERYFSNIRDIVWKEFEFKEPLDEKNAKYAEQMQESNSISIHIRRGDFLNGGFYILNDQYYCDAIRYIQEKTGNVKVFVFSDDVDAAKEIMQDMCDYVIVQGNNGKNSYRDMQLMSLCKHNVIANSTFSFWGAYLNKNPEKIVIAPSGYHRDNKEYGFWCSDWIKFDVEKYAM